LQASFFGFGPTADIEIDFKNQDSQQKALVKREASAPAEKLLLFTGKEAIEGVVHVVLKPGVRLDHTGIKIELFGQIGALPRVAHLDAVLAPSLCGRRTLRARSCQCCRY
jgi:hypothetical protein